MSLSVKRFAQIVSQIDPAEVGAPIAGPENRRAQRVALRNRATIVRLMRGTGERAEPVGVEVRDFSPRGIRFLFATAFARGEQFLLELPQRTGDAVQILCTVVHSSKSSEGPCVTGAEFTCVLRHGTTTAKADPGERTRIQQSILE